MIDINYKNLFTNLRYPRKLNGQAGYNDYDYVCRKSLKGVFYSPKQWTTRRKKCYVSIRPKQQTKRNISMQSKKNYPNAAQHDKNDTMINCRPHLGGKYWSIEGGMYYTTIKYAPLHQTVLGEASALSVLSTDEYSCNVL